MEKYRSTADPSTGIHPYLPQRHSRSIWSLLFSPLLVLIRLPILIISLALALILAPLLVLPQTFITRLCSRLLLFSLSSPYTAPAPPRVRSRAKAISLPTDGAIIVANYSSPITILHLLAAYASIFLVPQGNNLFRLSGTALLSFAYRGKVPDTCLQVHIRTLLNTHHTVVIFAEGVSTNGRAVLRFSPIVTAVLREALSAGRKIFVFGAIPRTAYAYWGVGRSFFGWILGTLGRFGEKVQACVTEVSERELSDVQKILARNAGIPALAVGAEGREDFEKHWREAGGMGR